MKLVLSASPGQEPQGLHLPGEACGQGGFVRSTKGPSNKPDSTCGEPGKDTVGISKEMK